MMMTEMDIETSVYYVHLTRLIAREDYIKFTRHKSTKTYLIAMLFYILQKITLTKIAYFVKIYYHMSFQDPGLLGWPQVSNVNTKFLKFYQLIQKVKVDDVMQGDLISLLFFSWKAHPYIY
jgi:hypothetical protein